MKVLIAVDGSALAEKAFDCKLLVFLADVLT